MTSLRTAVVCTPELAETLPRGALRWRCPRCGRGGITHQSLSRVRPGACRARVDVTPPGAKRSCAGCDRRQESLNRIWPGAGDLVARLAAPFARFLPRRRPRMLLRFDHGFGDAVQLTVVLRHLRYYHPAWEIDLAVRPGWGSLYAGLARRAFETEHVHELPAGPDYDLDRWLDFPEPQQCYTDSPATKAERCLREALGLTPVDRLCGYWTPFDKRHLARADAYYAALPAHLGVVLIHYQGRTIQRAKNIDERIIADVCRRARLQGCVPVVLDFERPVRSRLVDQRQVFCPTLDDPLWRGRAHGDAATIAALAHRASLCVAIDSGPGHVMAGDRIGTPTLIVWRSGPLHPLHYFPPAPHVTHVVPRDHRHALRANAEAGERFFRERYQYVVCKDHLRTTLPALVSSLLAV